MGQEQRAPTGKVHTDQVGKVGGDQHAVSDPFPELGGCGEGAIHMERVPVSCQFSERGYVGLANDSPETRLFTGSNTFVGPVKGRPMNFSQGSPLSLLGALLCHSR